MNPGDANIIMVNFLRMKKRKFLQNLTHITFVKFHQEINKASPFSNAVIIPHILVSVNFEDACFSFLMGDKYQ